jgi:multidrug efflux system membrane fusion protein
MLKHGPGRGHGLGRDGGMRGWGRPAFWSGGLQHAMKKRTVVVGVIAGLVLVGLGAFLWNGTAGQKAAAQAPRAGQRTVPVAAATASKTSVPIRLQALGTVTTIASVAIKTRLDSEIVAVKFEDGARVKQGDVLFVLDSRSIETEIKRVEAVIAGAEAQFEQASRDVQRYTDLVAKNATTVVTLNNAQTQVNISHATADSNKAALEGLRVQLSYCTIRAPISGRISMASVKIGNIARQADTAPLATLNQISPIYVSFSVAQGNLSDVRESIAAETATLDAIVPGSGKRSVGQVTMVENSVDSATGMVMIRSTMPNKDELLWPGTLVNTELTLRTEERITVPAAALQLSQAGEFVFVVKDDAVVVRPIKVERTVNGQLVIESGLAEGEVVVTDGQLLLSSGTKVTIRSGKAES